MTRISSTFILNSSHKDAVDPVDSDRRFILMDEVTKRFDPSDREARNCWNCQYGRVLGLEGNYMKCLQDSSRRGFTVRPRNTCDGFKKFEEVKS